MFTVPALLSMLNPRFRHVDAELVIFDFRVDILKPYSLRIGHVGKVLTLTFVFFTREPILSLDLSYLLLKPFDKLLWVLLIQGLLVNIGFRPALCQHGLELVTRSPSACIKLSSADISPFLEN